MHVVCGQATFAAFLSCWRIHIQHHTRYWSRAVFVPPHPSDKEDYGKYCPNYHSLPPLDPSYQATNNITSSLCAWGIGLWRVRQPYEAGNENILEEGFNGRFNEIVFAMLDARTKRILRAFHEILDRLVVE